MHFAATAFATAFAIVDPLGMIPLTLSVMARAPAATRSRMVDRAVIAAAAIMFAMGILGHLILRSLGITLPAFMIAGGILLLLDLYRYGVRSHDRRETDRPGGPRSRAHR